MLTYAALERISEAIAEEIAPHVNDRNSSVIVLSSNSKLLADITRWRAEMAAMDSFRARADNLGLNLETAGGDLPALNLTSACQALSLARTVLSTSESASPAGGTVQDQAFFDAVARQLRISGVSVLMPDTYLPSTLSLADNQSYLILSKLADMETLRSELRVKLLEIELQQAAEAKQPQKASPLDSSQPTASLKPRPRLPHPVVIDEARRILSNIEAYLPTMLGAESVSESASDLSKESPHSLGDASRDTRKGTVLLPFPTSHLASLLSADLFVQTLRTTNATHVLWLKTLESGGSVIKRERFLRSNVWYSGGAIGTYALFDLQGRLECSGNVYDYGGPIQVRDFRKKPVRANFDTVLQGGCRSAHSNPPTRH